MPLKPSYLLLAGGGAILAISGLKGWTISNALHDAISGTNPAANPTLTAQITPGSSFAYGSYGYGAGQQATFLSAATGGGAPTSGGGNPTANKAIAMPLAAAYGWVGSQWTALVNLWTRESGWSNTAKNPTSGAYGIAQALPASKYPAAGQESGGSSAVVQIIWGLAYIKARYGSPAAAWAHEQSAGWY